MHVGREALFVMALASFLDIFDFNAQRAASETVLWPPRESSGGRVWGSSMSCGLQSLYHLKDSKRCQTSCPTSANVILSNSFCHCISGAASTSKAPFNFWHKYHPDSSLPPVIIIIRYRHTYLTEDIPKMCTVSLVPYSACDDHPLTRTKLARYSSRCLNCESYPKSRTLDFL